MTNRSHRRKPQIRQEPAQIESGGRVGRSAAPAGPAEAAASLLADLAISKRSASRLQRQAAMTEADLYDEDALPA